MNNPYRLVITILVYFAATAILSALIGSWIDQQFAVKPYGTIGSLIVSYVVSWTGMFFYLKRTKKL